MKSRRDLAGWLVAALVAASMLVVACGSDGTSSTETGSEADVTSAETCVSVKDCKANEPLGSSCTDEVPENCNVACVYADESAARGTCQAPKPAPESCESVLDCAANKAQNRQSRGSCTDEVPENCVDSCDDGVCKPN